MQLQDKPLTANRPAIAGPTASSIPHSAFQIPVLAALAIGLYTTENFLPFPIPWLRIGISNIAILLTLYLLDKKSAVTVFFLKIVLGSLLSGRFLTPFFFFALAGGGLSLLVMIVSIPLSVNRPPSTVNQKTEVGSWQSENGIWFLSPIGVSILGSVSHNIGQLLVAYLLFIKSKAIFSLLPFLILLGIITGAIVGVLASIILEKLNQRGR